MNNKESIMSISDITGITVCSNTKSFMEQAYNSVRKFHPDIPIVIINGSDLDDPCAFYIKNLTSDLTTIISPGYNIGHGRGMCMGIDRAKTKYALIFDSDIEMLKSPLSLMLPMMEDDTFGIGLIVKKGFDGYDYGVKLQHKETGYMLYLHPYFQLINISNYKSFHPYVHHGAPCYLTMRDIHKKGLSNKIIKEFPNLGNYVKHYGQITRQHRKSMGLRSIVGNWVRK